MNQQKRGKVAKGLEVRVKRERSLNLAKSGGVKKKKIASKLTLSQVNFSGFASIPVNIFFASTYNVVVGEGYSGFQVMEMILRFIIGVICRKRK